MSALRASSEARFRRRFPGASLFAITPVTGRTAGDPVRMARQVIEDLAESRTREPMDRLRATRV